MREVSEFSLEFSSPGKNRANEMTMCGIEPPQTPSVPYAQERKMIQAMAQETLGVHGRKLRGKAS